MIPNNESSLGQWPADGLDNLGKCPVCGETERELIHCGLRDGFRGLPYAYSPGLWNLYRCRDCGTGYLDPRPNVATISQAYLRSIIPETVLREAQRPPSAWRQFRATLRNAYLNAHYGYRLKASRPWCLPFLSRKQKLRYDRYVAYLPYPSTGPGARVLDVGCGPGAFLVQLREVGWDVCGIEANEKAAAAAKAAGVDVRVGMIETVSLPEASFDAVILHHVIEHLHDPVSVLRQCWKLLKPGGVISIATPNLEAEGHRVFGADWLPLDPPRHLLFFTAASLARAFKSAGFEPDLNIRLRLGAQDMFKRSMHIRHGSQPNSRKPPLPIRARLQAWWLARKAQKATLAEPRLSEELVMLARKPADGH